MYTELSHLFKKDNEMKKEKYQPVSVRVCQSNVFESLMLDQLMESIIYKGTLSDLLS